jgi:uncharacterized protein YbjT (DUF2867 family)
MANTILITGGTGHIGSHMVEELIRRKVAFKVMVRSKKKNPVWERAGVEQVMGDFNDPKSLEKSFKGVDTLFSLTPFVENLVELGVNAVHAAKKAGVKHIVRSSALTADENATTIPRWHWEVEKAVEASGMDYTIIRPSVFMQNYLGYASSIKSQNAFYASLGDGKVSYVDVRDISAVAVAALTEHGHEGKIYQVTGGEALSNHDIAQLFEKTLGRTIKYVDIPESAANDAMIKMGMPPWMIQGLAELNKIAKAGYLAEVYPTIEKITGRKPISFARFIQDNLGIFQIS